MTELKAEWALAIGVGAAFLLLTCHIPVLQWLLRLDREQARADGGRAVGLTAVRYSLVALMILWIAAIGTLASWVGMPACYNEVAPLWQGILSLSWVHFGVAVAVVFGVTAWEALSQRKVMVFRYRQKITA